MSDEQKRERRRKQRGVGQALREDLYGRNDKDNPDPENSAQWVSPGNLKVRYGVSPDEKLWIECIDSTGKVYARTEDGDEFWLEQEML